MGEDMRRILFVLTVVASMAVTVTPASAAPDTAADFAADCNADGIVLVVGNKRYVGGTGALTGPCVVGLSVGAKLVFRGVTLTGTDSLAAISSPAETTIKVIDSTIKMSGPLELTAGCCAGDALVPEQDGRVVVRRSTLRGSSIQLVASFDWPNGVVVVTDSTLHATGPQGIQVRASDLGGVDGRVRVVDSSLTSAGDLEIKTGVDGKTRVRRNTSAVAGTARVTTGVGGTCRSTNNSPALPCT